MAAPDADNTGSLLIEDPALRLGFIQAPKQIVYARNLGHEAKSLYYILLDYAWQDGQCFPGYERLNDDMALSEKTTRQAMRQLEAACLVRQKRRGLGKTNIYILCSLQSATLDLPERHRTKLAATTEPEREKSRPGIFTGLEGERSPGLEGDTPPVHIKVDLDSELPRTRCGEDTPVDDVRADAPTSKNRQTRGGPPKAATGAEHVAEQIATAIGWKALAPATRAKWADALRPHLKGCTVGERERFVAWLVSNGFWCAATGFRLGGQLATEAEGWVQADKPATKVGATGAVTGAATNVTEQRRAMEVPPHYHRPEPVVDTTRVEVPCPQHLKDKFMNLRREREAAQEEQERTKRVDWAAIAAEFGVPYHSRATVASR